MSYASSHSSTPPPSPYTHGAFPGLAQRQTSDYIAAGSSSPVPPQAEASTGGPRRSGETVKQEARVDQMVQHLFAKAAHVISQARLTHVDPSGSRGNLSRRGSWAAAQAGTPAPAPRRDRWFNLELDETDLFREELRTWRSVTTHLTSASGAVPALILDIILDTSDLAPTKTLVLGDGRGRALRVGAGRRSPNILLERWTVDLKPPAPPNPPPLTGVYKHCIILFRALYALVQSLPAADLYRRLRKRTGGFGNGLKIGCRLSAGETMTSGSDEIGLDEPLTEDQASAAVDRFPFAAVQTPVGLVNIEVLHRRQADFSVEDFETVLSSHFFDEDYFRAPSRPAMVAPGSMPVATRGGLSPPVVSARPSYGSLSSRHALGPTVPFPSVPTATSSPAMSRQTSAQGVPDYLASQEGAFITSSRARNVSFQAGQGQVESSQRTSSELPRRPSVGQGHPFKSGSPSSASPSPLRPSSAASPRDIVPGPSRLSSSPNYGPSSSLRYQSPTYFDAPAFQPGSASGSGSISRIAPAPLRRYSSRGTGGSGGSSGYGGSPAPFTGPESLGRRSRLSSSTTRDEVEIELPKPSPQEQEDINAFLSLLESRPALDRPVASTSAPVLSRATADERLRALAGSLYREGEPVLLRPPRLGGRMSIEEERPSRDSSSPSSASSLPPPVLGSGSGLHSSASPTPDPFPRYVGRRQREASHGRRRSSVSAVTTPAFDEVEAAGRLELSQEESPSGSAAPEPMPPTSPPTTRHHHRHPSLGIPAGGGGNGSTGGGGISRPGSALSSRRESSVDPSITSGSPDQQQQHAMQFGRGRGRPGRMMAERDQREKEAYRSGNASLASSRSSVG